MYYNNRICYVDLDEDEVFHWKYVKREKVGNKWRYYYDDSNLTKMKAAADKYDAKTMQNYGKMVNAQKAYGAAQTAKIVAANRYKSILASGKNMTEDPLKARNAYVQAYNHEKKMEKQAKSATKKYNNSVERAERHIKKYEFKQIISFPRRAVSVGIVAAANWINDNRPIKKKKS